MNLTPGSIVPLTMFFRRNSKLHTESVPCRPLLFLIQARVGEIEGHLPPPPPVRVFTGEWTNEAWASASTQHKSALASSQQQKHTPRQRRHAVSSCGCWKHVWIEVTMIAWGRVSAQAHLLCLRIATENKVFKVTMFAWTKVQAKAHNVSSCGCWKHIWIHNVSMN